MRYLDLPNHLHFSVSAFLDKDHKAKKKEQGLKGIWGEEQENWQSIHKTIQVHYVSLHYACRSSMTSMIRLQTGKQSVTMFRLLWQHASTNYPIHPITHLHCPAFFYKRRLYLVLQVIYFLGKVEFWSSWLNVVLFAEGHPLPCKLSSFREGFKSQHRRPIIRDITRHFVDRVIHCKYGQDSVRCYEGRFFQRIHSTHKDIDRSQLWRFPFAIISTKQKTNYGDDVPRKISLTLKLNSNSSSAHTT